MLQRILRLSWDLGIKEFQQHVGWRSSVVLLHETWICLSRFLITCFGWCFSIGSSTHLWTSQLSCCALVTDSFTKTGGKFLSVLFVIFMRCGGLCSNTFSEQLHALITACVCIRERIYVHSHECIWVYINAICMIKAVNLWISLCISNICK